MSEVRWIDKLPALLAGLASLIIAVIVIRARYALLAAAVLTTIGLGFVGYSLAIKQWCVPAVQSGFHSAFHPTLRGCLRAKGWLEF